MPHDAFKLLSLRDQASAELRSATLGRLLCIGGATLGAVGIAGWLTGNLAIATVIPGQPLMMPNTAISVFLLGAVGALNQQRSPRRWWRVLSAVVILAVLAIGTGTILEYAMDLKLRLDQLFIHTHNGPYPGRPSPPSAAAISLLAAGLLLFNSRLGKRARPSEWLIFCALLIAFTALLGQLFGAGPLYRLTHAPTIGVAVPTAISLFLISLGLLLERSETGMMRDVTGPGPGSILLTRIAPASVLITVGFGLIAAKLFESSSIKDAALVFASVTVVTAILNLALLAVAAVRLNRASETLEEARARTRELIDQASDGIFIANLEGRYTDVNDAGCRLLGYSREEIVGKTIMDFIEPEDIERVPKVRNRLVAGGIEVSEWTQRRKDGNLVPVEVSTKIFPDGRWQAFVRDITARKRAEMALRLSEAKFAGIVSISADAIISVDRNQRIILFNEGARNVFGYTSNEMIGAPLETLIPQRFRAIHAQQVESFANGLTEARKMSARHAVIVGLRRNGEEFPADAAISMLSVGGDTILTVTLRDITEQKRVENEQRLLAEFGSVLVSTLDFEDTLTDIARLTVQSLADFCIIDVIEEDDEVRRARVVSRDPLLASACEALMRVPVDPSAQPPEVTLPEQTEPLLVEKVTPQVLSEWFPREEHRKLLESLEPRSAMVLPLTARAKHLGRLLLLSLSPARKYSADDLRLATALARLAALSLDSALLYRAATRATQARDDLLGIVAHDLRNPLQTILLDARHVRTLGPELSDTLGIEIGNAARRMNHLIQDLLDVTQMEAGHLSIRPTRLHIGEVISDLLEQQTPLASAASLELSGVQAFDLPDIWADPDRLMQVFENLIGNAIKFTKRGGQINIGAEAGTSEVVFSVADTGSGIGGEDASHIFERFWQVSRAARRGTGLGLAIVKGIVEAHGGRVWVESALGQGTTFFFTIPTASQASDTVRPAGVAPFSRRQTS